MRCETSSAVANPCSCLSSTLKTAQSSTSRDSNLKAQPALHHRVASTPSASPMRGSILQQAGQTLPIWPSTNYPSCNHWPLERYCKEHHNRHCLGSSRWLGTQTHADDVDSVVYTMFAFPDIRECLVHPSPFSSSSSPSLSFPFPSPSRSLIFSLSLSPHAGSH